MAEECELFLGADGAWQLTIADDLGDAITTYTADATLSATCWQGDDQAPLFVPSVAWIDPTLGTIRLTIAAGQTTGMEPGLYGLLLTIVSGSQTATTSIGTLRLIAAPGVAVAPRTYATLKDMKAECSWIEDVESLRGSRMMNFAPELAQASRWVEEQAMSRIRRAYREQSRRHRPIVTVTPITPSDGVDAGPGWGDSTIPDTTTRDAEAVLSGHLDDLGLMVGYTSDRGALARLTAVYALYLALDDQVGAVPGSETSLQVMAMKYRNRAVRMLPGVIFRIDADGDGVPDFALEH